MTTVLSRISVTAPAPRVVYQRTLLLNGQREPPVTTTPLLEDLPIPFEDCMVELDENEELDVDELPEEVEAVTEDADVPGIVAALTAANMPTPATAAKDTPAVRRCSRRRASSRERAWARVAFVGSMGDRLKYPA